MANLGTKAGDLIPSGGLIAGDLHQPNNATVSEYGKYYGTYSGADIKVVVHYPYDSVAEKAIRNIQAEIQSEIDELEFFFRTKRGLDGAQEASAQDFVSVVQQLQALRDEMKELDDHIAIAKGFPTSKVLGEITSFSWSTHRDKAPFRPLGSVYPRSYCRGPRTIAGSMVFTVFHEHVFHELARLSLGYYSTGSSDFDKYLYTTMLSDQLPPLDISLIFANEYGAISHMGFWGVEFFQEGGTFSIEDIYSENVIQYVARDIDPLRIISQREIDGSGVSKEWNQTASNMLNNQQASGHRIRRNPFI